MQRPRIEVAERPFTLTFKGTGVDDSYESSYPLSSREAERLITECPIISASADRVVLRPDQSGLRSIITPATADGGAAFKVERS